MYVKIYEKISSGGLEVSLSIDLAFMNIIEKTSNCIFNSPRLSLRYFEYVNALFGSLQSRNIENQHNVREVYCTNAMCTSK